MGLSFSKAKANLESIEESETALAQAKAENSELRAKLVETALVQAKAENSELWAKLEESETALAEANVMIKECQAQRLQAFWCKEEEAFSSEEATCPLCGKTFFQGGFHPATQKLWQHMGMMGKGHRKVRNKLSWDISDWHISWQGRLCCSKLCG